MNIIALCDMAEREARERIKRHNATLHHCPQCGSEYFPDKPWITLEYCRNCDHRAFPKLKGHTEMKRVYSLGEGIEVRMYFKPTPFNADRWLVEMVDAEFEADLLEEGRSASEARVGNCLWFFPTEEQAIKKCEELAPEMTHAKIA
jgi:DNA-directed RNA polymerase subunit RPC12/RpoP